MTARVTQFGRPLRGAGRPKAAAVRLCVLAAWALVALSGSASAQLFGDRPPPIPPASVPLPEGVGGGAVSLAPPSGPAAAPAFPPPAPAPAMTAPPGPASLAPSAPTAPSTAGQAVLALSA